MDTKVQTDKPAREVRYRLEDRRIYAANAYRVDWWHTYTDRTAALIDFFATLGKSAPGFYGPHADHRLVLVEDGAR